MPTVSVTIEGPPVPASRPRVPRYGRPYYLKTYATWRRMAESWLADEEYPNLKGPIAATIEIVCKRPSKPANRFPVGDIDNYVKAALDAVQAYTDVFDDDKQIVRLKAVKRYAAEGEKPRVDMEFKPCDPI